MVPAGHQLMKNQVTEKRNGTVMKMSNATNGEKEGYKEINQSELDAKISSWHNVREIGTSSIATKTFGLTLTFLIWELKICACGQVKVRSKENEYLFFSFFKAEERWVVGKEN